MKGEGIRDLSELKPIRSKEDLRSIIVDTLEIKTDMGREMVEKAMECLELFDSKQQDYGSGNISASGQVGVAVRVMDKASRMMNIMQKRMRGEKDVNHEALLDTFQDVANYGMIGMLLEEGKWE